MSALRTRYTICAIQDVLDILASDPHDLVISIEHPGAAADKLASPRIAEHGYNIPQLIQTYWDNDVEELEQMCTPEMAVEALDMMREYRGRSILVHCRGGVARSTATALMGIADELGVGREAEAVQILEDIRSVCMPNPLVVRLADKLLERDGALMEAVERHEVIQSRFPKWLEGKLVGMTHFHPDISPEKVLNWPTNMPEEQRQAIIARAAARPWKLHP